MKSSTIDSALPPLAPHFPPCDPSAERKEPAPLQQLISTLNLQPHIEGGYFVETDRDSYRVPNPFLHQHDKKKDGTGSSSSSNTTTFYTSTGAVSADLGDKLTPADKNSSSSGSSSNNDNGEDKDPDATRSASTTIHYLLTPASPLGAFHRNRGRTIHTLHRGRGRYVIIHADEVMTNGYDTHSGIRGKARIETFVVGQDVAKGERLQWIVEGGKYKSSFLLPLGGDGDDDDEALLISEVCLFFPPRLLSLSLLPTFAGSGHWVG